MHYHFSILKRLIQIALICTPILCSSQSILSRSHKPYGEIGFGFGTSYYIGDLNPYQHFEGNKLAFGIQYKWNPTPRHALKLYALRTRLQAYDSDNKDPVLVNRNLHFRTSILEVGAGLEINFYEFSAGKRNNSFTPYLFGGLSYLSFNPQAELDGVWFDLNPLNTEGQGSLLKEQPYKLNQIILPFGIGIKTNLFGRLSLSAEYGVRRLFTDYLDDVSTVYANADLLREDNGLVAVLLADRSLEQVLPNGTNEGTARGNPNNNDWYFVSLVSLNIRLGPPENGCWP